MIERLVREHLRAFQPYQSARSETMNAKIFLDANELSLGSPFAYDGVALHRYPDPNQVDLRIMLARQLALADVGFAFAPSIASTGPLPDLPQTFCFRDFRHLAQGIEAILLEEGREREALSALLLAIALLDGARIAGFEVGREERALEALLRRMEERGIRV